MESQDTVAASRGGSGQPGDEGAASAAAAVAGRRWQLWLAVGLVLLGAVLNTIYLFNHCPLDLSGDEAHYWEWSRHLDYGYYSKPPGIAWVIGAAIAIGDALGVTGDRSGAALMPVMRMAAVVFGIFSGMLSLLLARRIFGDRRAALSVTVLSAAVPMFAVGSLLITIDSPMYLCWAATVYCLWRAVEGNSKRKTQNAKPGGGEGWVYAAAVACAAGMLFKPVLIAIPACVIVAMWADPLIRRTFKTWHSLAGLLIVLLSQAPVVIWNSRHGWVTFRHILTQGGLGRQAGAPPKTTLLTPLARVAEYLGGQAGGMGGILFVLLVIAIVLAWKKQRSEPADRATGWRFLLSFTLPLWLFYFVMNLWKRTEPNWPAAAYFTGMILLAGVFLEGWTSTDARIRRGWRTWGVIAIAWGVLLSAVAMNMHRLYPVVAPRLAPLAGTPAYTKSWLYPGKWDQPMSRLRGARDMADIVERTRAQVRRETGQEPLIIATRYDTASLLSFYMPGHPFVFCVMSSVGGRQNQYDLWPGLNQPGDGEKLRFAGRPAILVGGLSPEILREVVSKAFDRVGPAERIPAGFEGVVLRDVVIYRAEGFRGWPGQKGDAW